MADLSLALLGPPVVERDGARVSFDTRKAVALLAVLSITGRDQGRDRLAALLWPESDTTRARGSLRRTLSVTAAAVGEGLVISRAAVGLRPGGMRVDVADFEALAARPGVAALEHEPGHQAMIRALAWTGQRSAAVRQYRDLVGILDRELAVRPLPETTRLYDDLRAGRLEPLPGRDSAGRRAGASWPRCTTGWGTGRWRTRTWRRPRTCCLLMTSAAARASVPTGRWSPTGSAKTSGRHGSAARRRPMPGRPPTRRRSPRPITCWACSRPGSRTRERPRSTCAPASRRRGNWATPAPRRPR